MKKFNKINIGCGKDIRQGYLNVDSIKLPGVDLVHDLNKYPWPFKNNSFEEVYCDNILEHLNNIIIPLKEISRISKKNAKVIIRVPLFPSIYSFADPTHKQVFTYMTFDYFKDEDYYTKEKFEIIKKKILFRREFKFLTWLFNLNKTLQKVYYVYLSFIIPAHTLEVELKVLKEK